jgi:arsenate reductase-like glutaredoxin family protein
MVIDKSKIFGIFIVFLISIFLISDYQKKVEIIFFTNPNCLVSNNAEKVLEEIKNDFKNKIYIRKIVVNIYNGDEPDTEEIKILREKYQVNGVPEIIIDGKEFIQKYTKDNLVEVICQKFIIKPEVCG